MQPTDSQVLRAHRAAGRRREAEWEARREGVCLLTPLHPERALSRALVDHLAAEMPRIRFTLRPGPAVTVVWICGYEPGSAELVAAHRRRHPRALLLVTGRGEVEAWRDEVLAAGADLACGWPVPFSSLSRLLGG